MRQSVLKEGVPEERGGSAWVRVGALDLGVEIEEGVEAQLQLVFDGFAASFEDVHGYVSFVAVFELDGSIADLGDLIGGQQTHAIDQCEICHSPHCLPCRRAGMRGGDLVGVAHAGCGCAASFRCPAHLH